MIFIETLDPSADAGRMTNPKINTNVPIHINLILLIYDRTNPESNVSIIVRLDDNMLGWMQIDLMH